MTFISVNPNHYSKNSLKKPLRLKPQTFNTNGRILFEGKSNIDGKNIVVIITGLDNKTSNEKTGDMLQTWILLQDHKPNEAHKNGLNKSVCGSCPHMGSRQNSCYVKWFQAPLQVWKSYKNNRYDYFKKSDLELVRGRSLRLGSAGDPTVIDLKVWEPLLKVCKNHTGYTHQWRSNFAQQYKGIVQASCDSFNDYLLASGLGFKCFYVKHKDTKVDKKLFVNCGASIEAGKKTECSKCALCDGNSRDIVINAHGSTSKYVLVEA